MTRRSLILREVQDRIDVVLRIIGRSDLPEEVKEVGRAEYAALGVIESLWITQSDETEDFDLDVLAYRAHALRATAVQSEDQFSRVVARVLWDWHGRIDRLLHYAFLEEQMN